jgi:hypothetical protein
MSQQREKRRNQTFTRKLINVEDRIYDIDEAYGDLSAWEYFSNTYDDACLFEDYGECDAPSNIAIQQLHTSDENNSSTPYPTTIHYISEMPVQPIYCPDTRSPTKMEAVQYTTNSSRYPDLSLLHHNHQFQHHQQFKHQPSQQQHSVTSFMAAIPPGLPTTTQFLYSPPTSSSHPMLLNMPGCPMSFITPSTALFHSQNFSCPSTLLSQQPTSFSEEYHSFQQPRLHQLQYQRTMGVPIQQHTYQPVDTQLQPLHQPALYQPEPFASIPSTSLMDPVFPWSVAALEDFQPEHIHPANKQVMTLAKTDTATRIASENSPSTMYYSRKKVPPHRNHQKASREDNTDDSALPGEVVYHLELPSFVLQVMPPYRQHKNTELLLKPFTPYNYFYRDERENIVHNFSKEDDPLPPPLSDFTITKMHALLYEHWYIDPVKRKRSHRKSHGKVSFETLSKTIAQRWHSLPDEGREFYRNVSFLDNAYYRQERLKIK